MPIVFIAETNEYNPLSLEPYCTFNKELLGNEELDGSTIRLGMVSHQNSAVNCFGTDGFYCDNIVLSFVFTKICNGPDVDKDILVHHIIEYDFDSALLELQQTVAEVLNSRSAYFYFSGVKAFKAFEASYHLTSNSTTLVFNYIVGEEKLQSVCNQIVSHDIAIFSRGW